MFCIVKGLEDLGIAKVIDTTGTNWTIEFFDSPASLVRETHRVSKARVIKRNLGSNTRIYCYEHSLSQWLVGRVLQDDTDFVEVRFPNRTDVTLSHEKVFVRWKKPIVDPVTYLANFITETPQYAEARSNFLTSYISQRGISWGISALMSSAIELESHQINVIRRVLNDASQRYLLADEVGLGKTIEAGVIIRQAVLDDPRGHRVVVLVPNNLVKQWRLELIQRFGLKDFLDDSVVVLAQEISSELKTALTGANLLVIDEAHHLASGTDERSRRLYDMVKNVAQDVDRLLLLSATPVLRNESGFLRMLHLLDPVVYDLSDEDSFRSKIIHRQSLAEAVATLDPQNSLQLNFVLDDLIGRLPGDARLKELINSLKTQLVGVPDEDDPQLHESIRLLRAHLSETYRLHRRILRNRRKQVTGLTPERNGSQLWVVPESQMQRLESILEVWRINATSSCSGDSDSVTRKMFADFYWKAIASILEQPGHLKEICQARLTTLNNSSNRGVPTFDNEINLLKEVVALVDYEQWIQGRLKCLTTGIQKLLTGSKKVVVFCSDRNIADAVFAHLKFTIPMAVVRHEVTKDDEMDNENAPWLKFLSIATVNVLICDRSAEEGINLQGGNKVVVHFDLPIEPNRIEQRMGRVDRYGSGFPVQSILIVDEGSKFQKAWLEILKNSLGVFNRSISSLQYLVEEQIQHLPVALFSEGVEALEGLATHLGGPNGAVNRELKLIDEQDGLDELSPLAEDDTEAISDIDSSWQEIRQSVLYWVIDTLMFVLIPEPQPVAGNATDPPFRFQYQKPGAGGPATLVPLSGFLDDFLGAIDYESRRSNSTRPLSFPHTAHRITAVKRGVRLLRYGDEFIEAVKSFSDLDDRGRSFALWRQILKGFDYDNPRMFFRFDFLIETKLDDAETVLANSSLQSARSAIARRGDALFPPNVTHVWVDEDGEEPDMKFVETFLNPRYAKNGVVGRYIDTNIKLQRFGILKEAMPDTFSNWGERCVRMREKALSVLVGRKEFDNRKHEAIKKARVQDEIRKAQLETRIQTLEGANAISERAQLQLEIKLNAALYRGISTPSIKVDVAGVVFLSKQPFTRVEQIVKGR